MKTNLLFIQFALASVLFGLGAEIESNITLIAGLIFLILTVIFAISICKHKNEA